MKYNETAGHTCPERMARIYNAKPFSTDRPYTVFYAVAQPFHLFLLISFLSMLYFHYTNNSTDYEMLRILTVDDDADKVRWWWSVEEWESVRSRQRVW
jgi:hypothetical protein